MDDQLVRSELREKGYNFSKVARSLGLDYSALRHRYGAPIIQPIVVPSGKLPTDPKSVAKPTLAHFAVAVKANGGGWPTFYFNAIQKARGEYDAGTHEMVQEKRKDGWIVLYSIPRLVKDKRRPYFSRRETEV